MPNLDFIRSVGYVKWLSRYSRLQFRKRVLKADSRLLLPTGTWMVIPRHSASASEVFVTNADIDWGAESLLATFARANQDFIDIGAHIGYYSCYLSNSVRRVYAFEPDPRNIPTLRDNASFAGNVEVLQLAVSSKDGTTYLHQGERSEVSSLTADQNLSSSIPVTVTTIDSFVADNPGIDVSLIKVDAEENGVGILLGMETLVARAQPLILAECGYTEDLRQLCSRWNYTIFAYTRDRSTLQIAFREFASKDAEALWYKMLFLVPSHLYPTFSQQASCTIPS
jgi:FkbM family methyltransferase